MTNKQRKCSVGFINTICTCDLPISLMCCLTIPFQELGDEHIA